MHMRMCMCMCMCMCVHVHVVHVHVSRCADQRDTVAALTLSVHDHRMQKMSAQPLDILRQPREDTLDYVALTHQLSDDATIQLTALRQR